MKKIACGNLLHERLLIDRLLNDPDALGDDLIDAGTKVLKAAILNDVLHAVHKFFVLALALVKEHHELGHYEVEELLMALLDEVVKQMRDAGGRGHLPHQVDTPIDHHCHWLIEDQR
jgi:hypothetical protein